MEPERDDMRPDMPAAENDTTEAGFVIQSRMDAELAAQCAALPDGVEALKAALLAARADVATARAEQSSNLALIAHLKLQIETGLPQQQRGRARAAGRRTGAQVVAVLRLGSRRAGCCGDVQPDRHGQDE